MAASTIPRSGGPGSSVELSPVTIAVRDKVIEKFANQPLEEMNESVKQLLAKEEDEQKRLGIMAARVFILRQRILKLAEVDSERVVSSAPPKANDLVQAEDNNVESPPESNEWVRLRILDDCEVNGVRFPKTVIIDVKSVDADRLIESGNAELVNEKSTEEVDGLNVSAETLDGQVSENESASLDATELNEASTSHQATEIDAEAIADMEDGENASSAEIEDAQTEKKVIEEVLEQQDSSEDDDVVAQNDAIIETPSAAEVTAALEALSNENQSETVDSIDEQNLEPTNIDQNPVPLETENFAENSNEEADVAAELEALASNLNTDNVIATSATDSESTGGQDPNVSAELEAAASVIAAGPINEDTTELPPAGGEDEVAEGEPGKPNSWFEAQKNAEKSEQNDEQTKDEKT